MVGDGWVVCRMTETGAVWQHSPITKSNYHGGGWSEGKLQCDEGEGGA